MHTTLKFKYYWRHTMSRKFELEHVFFTQLVYGQNRFGNHAEFS